MTINTFYSRILRAAVTGLLILTAACFCACGTEEKAVSGDNDKLQIITTVFPEYDWVQNILGNNPAGAEVTMLLDNGVDLHSYQPTAEDIMKISGCDVFIYVGGESDKWVEDALQSAANRNMIAISLLKVLGEKVKEEELVEGMEGEEEEGEEEGPEYDEHVWLSLKNAAVLVEAISEAIARADAGNAQVYKNNAQAYTGRLKELDKEYETAVREGKVKTLLFGDRFPFRYMTEDYGLTYYAAFTGCSAET